MHQNKLKYKLKKEFMSVPRGLTVTVPDEAMTVREIMERHVRGLMIPNAGVRDNYDSGASFDSQDLEQIKRMDQIDLDEYRKALAAEIAERKKQISEVELAVKKREAENKKAAEAKEARQGDSERDESESDMRGDTRTKQAKRSGGAAGTKVAEGRNSSESSERTREE